MNGFEIIAKNEIGKKRIQTDLKNTRLDERTTMRAVFKRRITEKPYKLTYELRKLYRLKFNNNLNSPASAHAVGDIIKSIDVRYKELGLIKDVDYSTRLF